MSPKFLCCMFLLGFLHMTELDAFEYINCVKLKGRHTSINSFRKEKKKKMKNGSLDLFIAFNVCRLS